MFNKSSGISVEKLKGYAYAVYPSTVPTSNKRGCFQTSNSSNSSQQSVPVKSVHVGIVDPRGNMKDPVLPSARSAPSEPLGIGKLRGVMAASSRASITRR
jgi:hypothetical protein